MAEVAASNPAPANTVDAPQPAAAQAAAAAAAAAAAPGAAAQAAPAQPNSASLYVGDLHSDVTEAVLFDVFSKIGPVASIRVCRDAITRRSLGYAYVNFNNNDDAERAIEELNYEDIRGRSCRIMWSQRDPSLRKSGVGNIFIKNLDKTINNQALYDTFSAFGEILSCKVVCDSNGNSRGFGFVHYDKQEQAQLAIEKVNGMLLNEMKVYVGPFKTRKERLDEYGQAEKRFTNVYVKNLPKDFSQEKLEEMFTKFGEITSAVVKLVEKEGVDPEKLRSFGFVAFKEPAAAMKAVEDLNDTELEGGKIFVGRAQKKAERLAQLRRSYEQKKMEMQARYKGVNLYVKNLEETIDDEKLREAFKEYGTITSAKVMCDDKGASKGFGFVCFSSADEATRAVTEMNGRILVSKPLYVALAQRKDERQQQLSMQRSQRMQAMRMQGHMPAQMYPQQPGMVYMPQTAPMARPPYFPPQVAARRGYPPMMQGGQQFRQPMAAQQMAVQGRMGGGRGGSRQGAQKPRAQNAQFRQQTRNMPAAGGAQPAAQPAAPVAAAQPVPQAAIMQPGQEPLTASALAQASDTQAKQMLGERLFRLIEQSHPKLAGKVTGMLLEMDNSELLHLLEDSNALGSKVQEAIKVLKEHARTTGQKVAGLEEA